jgi:hypothetical protein
MMHAVTALALSSDGRTLAIANGVPIVGQSVGALSLWDLRTRMLVAKLPGHGERINALAFSPDGEVLASGGGQLEFVPGRRDYSIRLWASPSGNALSPPWVGHEERVVGLTFVSGGARLASIDAGGTVRQWRVGWREWARAAEERGAVLRDAAAAEGLRAEGERLASAGDYRRALARYTTALNVRKTDPGLLWARAQMLIRLNRLPEALTAQTAAIDNSPFDGVRLFERGKLRYRLDDSKGAVADFTTALELAPFIIRPAPVVADQLLWNRQVHDAAIGFSSIAVADVRSHRALARLQLGDVDGAEIDVNEAFALGLRSGDLYLTRAILKRKRGDVRGAVEDEVLARKGIGKK